MDLLQLLWLLMLDTSISWLRMLIALALSVIISLIIGIYAARTPRASRFILPIVDIFQTLPILAFFPFAIYVVVVILPGFIGINAAVIFLIVTSMIWNIIFGVYESIKTLPNEFLEVSNLYRLSLFERLRKIYIPAAMPKVAQQSVLSWSIGLFYLVTSEIFSTGNANYSITYGIGVEITKLAFSGDIQSYLIGLGVFILFVIATRFLLFRPMENYFNKYNETTIKSKVAAPTRKFGLFKEIEASIMRARSKGRPGLLRHRAQIDIKVAPELAEKDILNVKALAALFVIAALVLFVLFHYNLINSNIISYEYTTLVALAFTFARIWLVFALIMIIAVPVSVYLIFMSKHTEGYLTLFQILASIPATIVLPIIVVVLSKSPHHSELVAFAVFFLSGIWYIIFSAIADAKTLQSNIAEVRKVFHVTGLNAWKNIYIQAIIPGLITGSVTAIAAEWNASIVAEYFTSTGVGNGTILSQVGTGIGKLLDTSLGSGNLTLMLVALINLTVMIILINTFVWKRFYRKVSEIYK